MSKKCFEIVILQKGGLIIMNIEARKLKIIEAFASLEDNKKITQIESLLFPKPSLDDRRTMLSRLSGTWTKEEAEEMKRIIEEGCEKVDKGEW